MHTVWDPAWCRSVSWLVALVLWLGATPALAQAAQSAPPAHSVQPAQSPQSGQSAQPAMPADRAQSTQAAQLAPTGTLRVAFLRTNPVQGRVDPTSGTISGPVAELMPALARRLGVPYRLVPVEDAAAVMASVRSGATDMGLLAVEAARATQVDFSIPYALMGNAYLVRADAAFARSEDVDRPGVTVGAVRGQSQQIWVSEHLQNAEVRLLPAVPPAEAIVRLLVDGTVDAFAANRQRMEDAARTSPGVRVLDDDFSFIGQALVVRRGDAAGLALLDAFVREALRSGLVAAAIDRAGLSGVRPAPVPAR
ncbi:MAG: transporter substrate-binding domain-containing protein [Vicinamibacterales bacterium]